MRIYKIIIKKRSQKASHILRNNDYIAAFHNKKGMPIKAYLF